MVSDDERTGWLSVLFVHSLCIICIQIAFHLRSDIIVLNLLIINDIFLGILVQRMLSLCRYGILKVPD